MNKTVTLCFCLCLFFFNVNRVMAFFPHEMAVNTIVYLEGGGLYDICEEEEIMMFLPVCDAGSMNSSTNPLICNGVAYSTDIATAIVEIPTDAASSLFGAYVVTLSDGLNDVTVLFEGIGASQLLTAADVNAATITIDIGGNVTVSGEGGNSLTPIVSGSLSTGNTCTAFGTVYLGTSPTPNGTLVSDVSCTSSITTSIFFELIGEFLDPNQINPMSNYDCISNTVAQIASLNVTGGTAPYTINSANNVYSNSGLTTPYTIGDVLAFPNPPLYIADENAWSLTVQDSNGCESTISGFYESPQAEILALASEYCQFDPANIIYGDPNGFPFVGPITDSTDPLVNDLPAGIFTSDCSGCIIDNGDNSAVFDPFMAGLGQHIISFTVGGDTDCSAIDQQMVNVYPSFIASFDGGVAPNTNPLPLKICSTDSPIVIEPDVLDEDIIPALTGLESIFPIISDGNIDGVGDELDLLVQFSGDGITDNADGTATFDPSGLIEGVYTISVSIGYPECIATMSQSIEVIGNSTAQITSSNGVSLCGSESTILTVDLLPEGGKKKINLPPLPISNSKSKRLEQGRKWKPKKEQHTEESNNLSWNIPTFNDNNFTPLFLQSTGVLIEGNNGDYTGTYDCISEDAVQVTININGGVAPFTVISVTETYEDAALTTLAGDGSIFPTSGGLVNLFVPAEINWDIELEDNEGTIDMIGGIFYSPNAEIVGLDNIFCTWDSPITISDASLFTSNPLPNGAGYWTTDASGIVDNGNGTAEWNPFTASTGQHSVFYTIGNDPDCSSIAQKIVNVYPDFLASFDGSGAANANALPATIANTDGSITIEPDVLDESIIPAFTALEDVFFIVNNGSIADELDAFVNFDGVGVVDNGDGTATFNPLGLAPGFYSLCCDVGYESCLEQQCHTIEVTGIENLTYQWSTGVATQTIEVSQSGTYTVTVSNAANCTAISEAIIEVFPISSAFSEADIVVCNCLTADSLELVAFYNATGGDDWTDKSGWLVEPVSEWFGVTLNENGCSVIEIDLNANNLSNVLLDLNLPDLTELNLDTNQLIGEIPNFSKLPLLQILSLDVNELTGEIPDFDQVPNLKAIYLAFNNLNGNIPNFNLPDLECLWLRNNQFIFSGISNAWDFISSIDMSETAPCLPAISYKFQDTIPLLKSNDTLYVQAGELSDNQYIWFKNGVEISNMPVDGDSLYTVTESGIYRVEVTNDIITKSSIDAQNLILISEELFITATTCSPDPDGNIYVTTLSDNGDNNNPTVDSFRAAIICANETAGPNTILFDLGTEPFYTIQISSVLPVLTDSHTIIDPFIGNPNMEYIELMDIGNLANGIVLQGDSCELYGFYIHGFHDHGVLVNNCSDCKIGAVDKGNIISGNGNNDGNSDSGIYIYNNSNNVRIEGNNIGTTVDGNGVMENYPHGIYMNNSTGVIVKTNLISGNETVGIYLKTLANNTTIEGNTIGLNKVGNASLGNQDNGIFVDTSSGTTIRGNYISGHEYSGIQIHSIGVNNLIEDNKIGTNKAGDEAIPNGEYGIYTHTAAQAIIRDNLISGNGIDGIRLRFSSDSITIENNSIGTNEAEDEAIPNEQDGIDIENSIGTDIRNNLISGNGADGVFLQSSSNNTMIKENTIGTNKAEDEAIPNGVNGVRIQHSDNNIINDNLISENTEAGVAVREGAINTLIVKNLISGNNTYGVLIESGINTQVGNQTLEDINTIAHNPTGIYVNNNVSNTYKIHQNSIFCNTDSGITTSLTSPPIITQTNPVSISGTSTINDTIEVFLHDDTGCNGVPCQGKTYLGTTIADPNGDWSLSNFTETITVGQEVVATATNGSYTSEFSTCKTICPEYELNIVGETVFCQGSSTILSTDDLAFTNYEWSNGSSDPSINVTEEGVYTVTVTDGNDCSATASTEINMIPIPSAYWGEDIVDCNCLTADSLELVNFYNVLDGDNWIDNSGWLVDPMGDWFGVTLSDDGCSIDKLSFYYNNLAGSIYDLSFPNLTYLRLEGNDDLIGDIPNFNNLPSLTTLWLSHNSSFVGNIPNFDNLSNLTYLRLSGNALTGNVPDFDNLPNLTYLSVGGNNNLTGNIPNFNNLPFLNYLYLHANNLTGNLPEFDNLSSLIHLDIYNNELTGSVPNFDNLANLTRFYFYNNNFIFSDIINTWEFISSVEACNTVFEPCLRYSPQAIIPLFQINDTLYVEVGGDIEDNTYYWYKNGVLDATITEYKTYTVTESANYRVEVTNETVTNSEVEEQNLILVSEELFITATTCSPDPNGNIYVTTLSDNGDNDNPTLGSLRAAIICANNTAGANHIYFSTSDFSSSEPYIIQPTTELPALTDAETIIDAAYTGSTSTGYIELDGSLIDESVEIEARGLTLQGNNSEICGLYIHSFPDDGVVVDGCDGCKIGSPDKGNIIAGNGRADNAFGENLYILNSINIDVIDNFIGTDVAGLEVSPYTVSNSTEGIYIGSSSNINIGGSGENEGNLISGNAAGLWIDNSDHVWVGKNLIGTTVEGDATLANADCGIHLSNATDCTIGELGAGNVISGNACIGIFIEESSSNIDIHSNYIGTDILGSGAVSNLQEGIYTKNSSHIFIGSEVVGTGNLISGNGAYGVRIDEGSESVSMEGNTIGLNATDFDDLGNSSNGIYVYNAINTIIGGTSENSRNIISGNDENGIYLWGEITDNTLIQNNYIGLNSTGTAFGNTNDGIVVADNVENTIIKENVISGNDATGIWVTNFAINTTIIGNKIGTNIEGTSAIGNTFSGIALQFNSSSTKIGGSEEADRNIISGNGHNGIWMGDAVSTIEIDNNFIGTDITGNTAVPNTQSGISIETASSTFIGLSGENLISGNGESGITLRNSASDITIEFNKIGTDISGTAAIPNTLYGIDAAATDGFIFIGSNLVSGNGEDGIHLGAGADLIEIAFNKIGTDSNGTAVLGNGDDGIDIKGAIGTQIFENLVSGNVDGIDISFAGNSTFITQNKIGTNIDATATLGNTESGIEVDDSDLTEIFDNIIGGNNGIGILIENASDGTAIFNNFIGANEEATIDLGNGFYGISLNTATNTEIGGNLIGNNFGSGIYLGDSDETTITSNFIGTNIAGTNLANGELGIEILSSTNTSIGSTSGDTNSNTIAYNLIGIQVGGASDSYGIHLNSIYCNNMGIAITTSNIETDAPVIEYSNPNGITGTATANATIEVFVHDDTGCEGVPCQGKFFLGSAIADESGYWGLDNSSFIQSLTIGETVVATATLNGNTSEFAACAQVCPVINPLITGQTAFCEGEINTLTTNGFSDFTAHYLWSTGESVQEIEVNDGGIYTVTVTDGGVCSGTAMIEVIQNPNPIVEIQTPEGTSFCEGNSIVLFADISDVNYKWSTGEIEQTIQINAGGTYTITVTDANNCSSTDEVFIEQLVQPYPEIEGSESFCEGESTVLSLTEVYVDYLWSNGSIDPSIEVTESGVYGVTVSDGTICVGMTSVEVIQNDNPFADISAGEEAFCSGVGLDIFVHIPVNSTNIWSNGDETQLTNIQSGGIYTVTVTNENNCSTTAFVSITELPLPELVIDGELSFCSGGSTVLTLTETYSFYEWSTGSQESFIEVTEQGFYSVIVTDVNGCGGQKEIFVVENDLPSVVIQGENTLCAPNILLSAFTLGGSGEYFYKWPNGSEDISIEVTETGTYTVTVTDFNGCTAMAEKTVGECIDCDVIADFVLPDSICTSTFLLFEEVFTENTTTGGTWESVYLGDTTVVTDEFLSFPEIGFYTVIYSDTSSISDCSDSHSDIIYAGFPDEPFWSIEGGNKDICKTDLPIAVFFENEGGAWCCEDFLNCNATDENCFTTTDGQVYFDPIIDLNNAVETYELSYVTSFENCNTHITKTINIYAPPSIPEVSQPNQIFCLGEVIDAFLFVSTPLVYSDQFFTFNVYDESGTLLISTVKPNEDMIDFTNWLVNSGTYTFSITTVNGTCESEGVEVSFLVEDCGDCDLHTFSSSFVHLNGLATYDGGTCFSLLDTETSFSGGSIWHTELLNLNYSFELSSMVYLGGPEQNNLGADGISLTLHRDADGSNTLGVVAGQLGYGGIFPAVTVELDIYENENYNDVSFDHIDVNLGGMPNDATSFTPVSILPDEVEVEDGNYHLFEVLWDSESYELSIYIDGFFRGVYTKDLINSVFGGANEVYWGFTAGTGTFPNPLGVCDVSLIYCPIDILAVDDFYTTPLNTPIAFSPLENDLGNCLEITSFNTINGTLEQIGDTLTYTPDIGFTGIVTIEYFITDCIGQTAQGVVTIEVTGNDVDCSESVNGVVAEFINLSPLCIDQSIEFLNLSENTTAYEWLIDGEVVSTDFDLFRTFDVVGDYVITLNASNEFCSDTFEETFNLLDCSQIEAVNDTVYLWTVSEIAPFIVSFNILENDIGEGIELREVFYDDDIQVGEGLSFEADGDVFFQPSKGIQEVGVIEYEIEDVNGQTAVADLVLIIDVISGAVDSDSSLVASILGECVSFENAKVTGSPTSYLKIDAFQLDFAASIIEADASELPFSEGVLLTTGSGLDGILSPNTIGSLGTNNESAGDIDLAKEEEETFDACALEFDFTAISESISFPYWFGSEEYIGGEFPDRMAIFISGGEYTEPTNIAVLPDANVPIGVETVNEIENKDYFVTNAPKALPQYDGLTVLLEAVANVTVGETYHIKMVIADVGDGEYDSGLFIKANMSAEDLDLEVSNDVLINQGESTELFAEVLNTTANVVYNWSPSETLDDVNSATPMATPSETTTYYVTATLGNCEFMDSVLVTVAEVVPCEGLSAGTFPNFDPYVCFEANVGGDISLITEGFELRAGDVLGYVLQDASGTSLAYSSVDANFSFEDLDSPFYNTEYFVSAVVGVDNGSGAVDFEGECVKYSEAFPVVFLEEIILSPTIVCDNNDEFRIEVSATGGLPSYLQDSTYHLPQYGLSFLQSETVDLGPFNNGKVVVIEVIDDSECTSISTVEHNGLAIFVGGTEVTNGSLEISLGESIGLTVITDEGTTFDWTPSETLDDADASNPTANPTETTTYTLTAMVNDGCELTAMVTITVLSEDPCAGLSAGTLSLTEPYYVCFGDKVGGDTPVIAEGSSVTEGNVLGYVLQDAEGVTLAYRSANANFGFGEITNAEYNTEYFVLAVVGADDGSGTVDFEGECVFYSDSVSVVFLQQIILSTNILCENNETFSVEVSATGGLPAFLNTELYTVVASGQTFLIDGNIEVGPFGSDELVDIEVVDGNGCMGMDSVENYQLSILVEGFDLTSDTLIINEGESISLAGVVVGVEPTVIIDYTWLVEESAISQLPTLGTTPDTSGVYNLMVEIDGNCTLTADITVLVLPTAQDCVDAIVVCDTEPIYYNSDGEGIEEIDGLIEAGCLGNGGEYHSTWFRLQIDTATAANELLLFTISPNDGKEDYDFALYKSNDCGNLDEPIRCTAAPPSIESANTGLRLGATDTVEVSAMDDGFVKPVSVNDGEVYYLLVNNFAGNLQGFKLEWTGNVVFNCIPIPECDARGGELSLNQTDYCDESNISVTWTWEEENDLLKHHYVLAADENTIIPIDTIGTFCRVGLNYEPGINPNDYTTIDEIEAAIENGVCMALSNIVCFDVFEIPDAPTLMSKECDHELLHLNVNALQDATISWYAGDTLFVEGNDVHIEVAGTYSVSQTLNDCESNSLEVVVSEADMVCLGDCPENLVQNYSFEEFEICPDFGASIREANFWRSPLGTAFEADYFNECNSALNSYGVPQNLYGTQSTILPEEMAYAGIVAYNGLDNDITKREFLQTELTDTLIEGQTYCVSMQVSLAESSQFAINNLGIYFSDSQINGTDIEGVLNPQIQHPAFLTDTVNWMEIQGTFKATEGMKHLIIGNFDPNNGRVLMHENGNGQAYYYIDMIQIRPINEIEGFTVFNQDNEELEVVDNTVVVCPEDTIRMEAMVSSTNYSCDLGWGNSVDNLVSQTSFTVSPLESDTVYQFWVSNGFCDIADSLVVVLGEESGENGECVLSVCSGAEVLMNALQNVGVDLPYSRTAMEVQSMDLEDLVRYELSQLAENTVGFDSNLLADFEVNMLMNSLQTACDPTRLQILPNSIVYDNSDPSNYAYVGEDQLTYTVYFPGCEAVTQTLRVNIQCPIFEPNGFTSDCNTVSFKLSNPIMIASVSDTIDLEEAYEIGWSYEYKIEGINDEWQPASQEQTGLTPDTSYTVFMRVVRPNPTELIFYGSNAEQCAGIFISPPLNVVEVDIIKDCLDDGVIELEADVNESYTYDFEWSTGDTTEKIEVEMPFEEEYWVRVVRSDGCEGVDTIFNITAFDLTLEDYDPRRCTARIRIEGGIPDSVMFQNEDVFEDDCWWDVASNSYKCDLVLPIDYEDMAEVRVYDETGDCESILEFDNEGCSPRIQVIKPNPSRGIFTVELTGIPKGMPLRYDVYSMDHRLVLRSGELAKNYNELLTNRRTVAVDLRGDFYSGLYYVQFIIGDGEFVLTDKLIKTGW